MPLPLAFKYYRSATRAPVERCLALIDKARGMGPNFIVLRSANTTYPGYGCPVCAGSQANPDNPGVKILEAVKASVLTLNPHPRLTVLEQTELLLCYTTAVELPDDWWYRDANM